MMCGFAELKEASFRAAALFHQALLLLSQRSQGIWGDIAVRIRK
jgi:hypothetical protein